MDMQEIGSQFKPYSLGEVLEDKELLNDIILVRPIEAIGGTTGQQVQDTLTIETDGTDAEGNPYTASTNTDNVIKATWLRWGSQRITSPDVRRQMRVMLYRYADKDEYYWEDIGLDPGKKRLETIIWGINNNADGDDADGQKPENMHTVEWSTHTKQLTLRTCKSNNEMAAFIFQFNLGTGYVLLADDNGNELSLDSSEAIWYIKNTFGSFFSMDKNNIFAYAAELIDMETKLLNVKAETVKVTAKLFQGDISELFHVNTPNANFTGNVTVGNISTGYDNNGKGMVSKGDMRVEGTLVVTGDARISGHITCDGIDSTSNVNAPNIR